MEAAGSPNSIRLQVVISWKIRTQSFTAVKTPKQLKRLSFWTLSTVLFLFRTKFRLRPQVKSLLSWAQSLPLWVQIERRIMSRNSSVELTHHCHELLARFDLQYSLSAWVKPYSWLPYHMTAKAMKPMLTILRREWNWNSVLNEIQLPTVQWIHCSRALKSNGFVEPTCQWREGPVGVVRPRYFLYVFWYQRNLLFAYC